MPVSPTTESSNRVSSTRRGALSIVMWVFGISTTLLLVAMWGRAITVDQSTVAESASVFIDSDIAQDRVVDWIEDAVVQTQAISPEDAGAVIENVRSTPQMNTAIHNLTAAFVDALFAPEGSDPVVDVRAAMEPAVPVIAQELAQRDLPITESMIVSVLDANDVDMGSGDTTGVVSAVREARSLVTTAVVVALAVMMLAAATAVWLSEEKFAMVRTLGIRVLLSALSFALFFRLGGWALDPERGRSPIAGGAGVLLGSNGHVFVFTALIAAAVAAIGGWTAWRRKVVIPTRSVVVPTDDDTRELVSI
jgi:hypothetical protein